MVGTVLFLFDLIRKNFRQLLNKQFENLKGDY